MLKGLFILIIVAFLIGAVILLLAVNYLVSVFRRIRQGIYGDGSSENDDDNIRRHSNQYSFKRTAYSGSASGGGRGAQQKEYRQYSQRTSSSKEPEVIVDTRDPRTVNRQIISDDEGEYVDFIEEK